MFNEDSPLPKTPGRIGKLGAAVIVLAILIGGFFTFTTRVDAGDACAKLTFGKGTGQAGPGLHLKVPFAIKYGCLSGREQVYEVVYGNLKDSDSKADYKETQVEGKTVTGVTYIAKFTVKYRLPVSNVKNVYTVVGKTDERVWEKVVKFHSRAVVPQYLNTFTAEDLYYGNLQKLSADLTALLAPRFEQDGVILSYFELKGVDFEDSYDQKIAAKNAEIENANQKILAQETAKQEAERQRIEAEGKAEAARVDAQGQADARRTAADAAAYETTTQANANAEAVRINAEGEADAINLRGEALAQNPSVTEWERIQAIRDANVIYLPSDSGVLPILPIDTAPPSDK